MLIVMVAVRNRRTVPYREVVKQLLKKGVQVKAFVRDSKKAGRMLPVAAELVQGNVYQYADVVKAVDGVDAIICATGANTPTDPLGPFSVDYTVRFDVLVPSAGCPLNAAVSM
jgi:uncharacterized protein YbjT (DUF2867 family)